MDTQKGERQKRKKMGDSHCVELSVIESRSPTLAPAKLGAAFLCKRVFCSPLLLFPIS